MPHPQKTPQQRIKESLEGDTFTRHATILDVMVSAALTGIIAKAGMAVTPEDAADAALDYAELACRRVAKRRLERFNPEA